MSDPVQLTDAEAERLWADLGKLQRTSETIANGVLKLDKRVARIEDNDRRQDARMDRIAMRSGARSGRRWGSVAAVVLWLLTQWANAHGYRWEGAREALQGAASAPGAER